MSKKARLALNMMPPSFAMPTQDMIAEHLTEVAGAVSIPLIIQYAPALTGMGIAAETFEKISKGREPGTIY